MRNASPGAYAPIHHFQNDPRAVRLAAEFRKLVASARNYISSRPRLFPLGEDPLVQQMVSSAGFGPVEVHVFRAGTAERVVTALCVPTRVWKDEESRLRLLAIKREAKGLRTSCIIVPQRWLRATVRSSVARVMAGARHTPFNRRQLQDALAHLEEQRISSLIECASAIRDHDDPVGAILSMACRGLVEIDRSTPIDANTYAAAPLRAQPIGLNGGTP